MTKGTAELVLHLVGEAKKSRIRGILAKTKAEKKACDEKAEAFAKDAKKVRDMFSGKVEKR